eukprot:COSAG01_NODE_1085_length_11795_cov_256.476317_1_plen_70_part_10
MRFTSRLPATWTPHGASIIPVFGQGADEARERNLKLLLGHSYNPTQLEDSSMQRAPSVPDGEALSHCSSI